MFENCIALTHLVGYWGVAFMAGLLGGVHCVGMCGGIVSMLSINSNNANEQIVSLGSIQSKKRQVEPHELQRSQKHPQRKPNSSLQILLAYNLGRILSYSFAGAVVGLIGASVINYTGIPVIQKSLTIIAGLFMFALGLYFTGYINLLSGIEHLGAKLWKRIEPFGRRFIPVTAVKQAIPLGMVWGWLPCGLVYSMLIYAMSTGNWLAGTSVMLAFGLGTLPNLLAIGFFTEKIKRFVQQKIVRLMAGFILIIYSGIVFARMFLADNFLQMQCVVH